MITVHKLRDAPDAALAGALAAFEAQFTYPLGAGRSFRIEHGEDYARFFRAIGEAACFVAERDGAVVGVVGVAVRTLAMPDGSERRAAYVGDLKVAPDARGGVVLARLSRAADAWARPRVTAAYGVVMDGTRATPEAYTGRAGVEAFDVVGKLAVLRLTADPRQGREDRQWVTMGDHGAAHSRALTRGRYAGLGGRPDLRSEVKPTWLVRPDGGACGRLEDTCRAKRLIDSDGVEMRSAHLACFAYDSHRAAGELIGVARRRAAGLGYPALFVAVDALDRAGVLDNVAGLAENDGVVAPATVYGAGIVPGAAWCVSSSEI